MWNNRDYVQENGWYRPKTAGGGNFSLTYQSLSGKDFAHPSPIDFGTMNYGANSTRVIALVTYSDGRPITALSVGGVAFSQISGGVVSGVNNCIEAWISSGPLSGSSGDVQVSFSADENGNVSVVLYNLITATPAPFAITTANPGFDPGPKTISDNVPVGGGAIVAWAGGVTTYTFSGNAVVDNTFTGNGGNPEYYLHTTAVGSPVTVTATPSGNDGPIGLMISWGP